MVTSKSWLTAIGTHESGAIECKCYIQILQRDIVTQLVVAALQKS
jgi:hypothetical protein